MELIEISPPCEIPLNSEKLKLLLKLENKQYMVIKNESSTITSSWWNIFGFPAKLDENNKYQRIYGYVSCFKCFQTFIYSSKSGTTRLKEHETKCIKPISSSSASSIEIDQNNFSSSTQSTLAEHGFRQSTKLNEKDINNIKQLSAQWMCKDLRPFSTIEDFGFRQLAQELIRIGHKYGVVDVNDVLRSRHTTARTIYDLADSYRKCIKEKLIEPLQHRAVTISPDFWSDSYKNISYLGLNVSFVDANHQYFSIDLFCRSYLGMKSGDLVVKALETHLYEFGINDLAMVNILSDRGSNFVKGFRDFDPLFCFGHRLNNVLKTSFFQNAKKKKKKFDSIPTIDFATSSSSITVSKEQRDAVPSINEFLSSEEASEDDEDVSPSLPVIRKRKEKFLKSTNDNQQSLRKTSIDDIPDEAKNVLVTLKQCKKIVKFIKKSGLNKEIENAGGGTVHQAIDIRWLSIMQSLESILKSFKIIKKILVNKQQQKLMMNVDEQTIKQLLLLLKPFQDVIKMIQTGNSPSLHLVLLCTQTLRDVLKSYEALVIYDNSRDNHESKGEVGEADEDLLDELQGITFFLHRIRGVFDEMFVLDIRHYVATLLHPKYRSLKACTTIERSECYRYVRQQLQVIHIEPNEPNQQQTDEPVVKKFKGDLFRRFESDGLDTQQERGGESGNESEEYPFAAKKLDELDRYLNLELDKSKLLSNPLNFWKDQQEKFSRLSRLARSIFSIPATSAAVERQFSGAGLVIQERRTNLNPEQLDNILLVRSMQKYEHFLK